MRRIFAVILFFLMIYIGRVFILNPTGGRSVFTVSVLFLIFYSYLAYSKPTTAIIIFLVFLPFYTYVKFRIFHNSMLGTSSKDILLFLLFAFWALKKIVKRERVNMPPWWGFMIPYLLITSANILKAPSFMAGLLDWRIMAFYPISSIVFFDEVNTREKFIKIARYLLLAGIVVAFIGILQRLFFEKFGHIAYEQRWGEELAKSAYGSIFVTSTVGHHGLLGLYLSLLISLSYAFLLDKIKFINNHVIVLMMILFTLVIIFTSNRTAWVSFIVIALFLFLTIRKGKIGVFIGITAVFFTLLFTNEHFTQRFEDILDPLGEKSTMAIRYGGWRERLRQVLENPLGLGLGHVGMTARSRFGISDELTEFRGYNRVIDNFYITVFMQAGFPGFIFFLFFWLAIFFWILSLHKQFNNAYTILGLMNYFIMTVSGFTGEYFNFILFQMYFWFLLAVTYNLSHEKQNA